MQLAVGTAKKITGIMGAGTIDEHGKSFILVVPDVSVYDPGMSNSLTSAGHLMEAGCNDTFKDGFAPATFPLYRGSITTPDNLTAIVMEYAGHTWRLPKVRAISKLVPVTTASPQDSEDTDVSTCNSFAGFSDIIDHDNDAHVPDFLSTEHVEVHFLQLFELVCRNRKVSRTL